MAFVAFLASIGAGVFGALVGIGGGLILVPVLTVVLDVPLKTAIAASLVGVIATSATATVKYLDLGIADRRLGLNLLVATASGGVVGGLVNRYLDERVLAGLFGVVLVLVALQMIRQRGGTPIPTDDPEGGGFVSSYIEPSDGSEISYRARNLRL
ncbi:MAG: sulfite exporter TauE/SafE family protein, partial [Candidatus Limnocylindrales bacterium]